VFLNSDMYDILDAASSDPLRHPAVLMKFSKWATVEGTIEKMIKKMWRSLPRAELSLDPHEYDYWGQHPFTTYLEDSEAGFLKALIQRFQSKDMDNCHDPRNFVDFLVNTGLIKKTFGPILDLIFAEYSVAAVGDCLTTRSNKFYDAIRCAPTLMPAVGFNSWLSVEPTVKGSGKCETLQHGSRTWGGRLDKHLKLHPALYRKAVEEMMPYFQGRQLHVATGVWAFNGGRLDSIAKTLRRDSNIVPSICKEFSKVANCWVFTRCVRKQAKQFAKELTKMRKEFIGIDI